MRCLMSDADDPFLHLAWEDAWLDQADAIAPVLLLSVNRACVVVGKNQVPWRECNTALLREEGLPLARRISGGGTVYHDAGNLNYAFILPRDRYRQADVFEAVIGALATFGVPAGLGPHNGLFVKDRKISGTAFCYRRQHVLHHGTLLVSADLDRLRACCRPALPEIATRVIASQPAHVANLRDLAPSISIDALASVLARAAGAPRVESVLLTDCQPRAGELRADEWVFGLTPRFEVAFGGVTLTVERGTVAAVSDPDATAVIGCAFDRDALLTAANSRDWKSAAGFFQSLEKSRF